MWKQGRAKWESGVTAGGCGARDEGGNDFLAFEDVQPPDNQSHAKRLRQGSGESRDSGDLELRTETSLTGRPVSIFAIVEMGREALRTPRGPILPQFTHN